MAVEDGHGGARAVLAPAAMEITRPTNEDAVLLSMAESELFSRRFATSLGEHIPEALNERLRYTALTDWSPEDRTAIITAIRGLLPEVLGPLEGLGIAWFEASIEEFDLPDLLAMAVPEFVHLTKDRTLVALVDSLERGLDTPDATFSGDFRHLKRSFRAAEMRGRPCLLAARREGPFTVFEGLKRLAVIWSLDRAGGTVPLPIPAYVGFTEHMAKVSWAVGATGGPSDLGGAPEPSR